MKFTNLAAASLAASALLVGSALAESHATTKLRIQTHFSTEQLSGQLAAEYVDNIQTMSGGEIEVEMFYSSSVVKSVETFDAAATGILDCDMTGGSGYADRQEPRRSSSSATSWAAMTPRTSS